MGHRPRREPGDARRAAGREQLVGLRRGRLQPRVPARRARDAVGPGSCRSSRPATSVRGPRRAPARRTTRSRSRSDRPTTPTWSTPRRAAGRPPAASRRRPTPRSWLLGWRSGRRTGAASSRSGPERRSRHPTCRGAVALLLSAHPGWSATDVGSALLATARDLGPAGSRQRERCGSPRRRSRPTPCSGARRRPRPRRRRRPRPPRRRRRRRRPRRRPRPPRRPRPRPRRPRSPARQPTRSPRSRVATATRSPSAPLPAPLRRAGPAAPACRGASRSTRGGPSRASPTRRRWRRRPARWPAHRARARPSRSRRPRPRPAGTASTSTRSPATPSSGLTVTYQTPACAALARAALRPAGAVVPPIRVVHGLAARLAALGWRRR